MTGKSIAAHAAGKMVIAGPADLALLPAAATMTTPRSMISWIIGFKRSSYLGSLLWTPPEKLITVFPGKAVGGLAFCRSLTSFRMSLHSRIARAKVSDFVLYLTGIMVVFFATPERIPHTFDVTHVPCPSGSRSSNRFPQLLKLFSLESIRLPGQGYSHAGSPDRHHI